MVINYKKQPKMLFGRYYTLEAQLFTNAY